MADGGVSSGAYSRDAAQDSSVSEYMARLLVDLEELVERVVEPAFIRRLTAGDVTPDGVRTFACEYLYYCERFPRVVCAVAMNVPEDRTRLALVQNLWDEHGQGDVNQSHRELYYRFVEALGLDLTDARERASTVTRKYVDDLFGYCQNSGFLHGLGALGPGTEYTTTRQYSSIVDGLSGSGFLDENALEFFRVHIEGDPMHFSDFTRALGPFLSDSASCTAVREGAVFALETETVFWEGVNEIAL